MVRKQHKAIIAATTLICLCLTVTSPADKSVERALPGFRTNTARRSIDLQELQGSLTGAGKDDWITALTRPAFVSANSARAWLAPQEPVISVRIGIRAKAYPLQILMWHEIVNDRIGRTPVAVTFCPRNYSAIVFDRRVNGTELSFGVSGFQRDSNLVMYDRQTESLWQQITGEAIVGNMLGSTLKSIPAQIISFEQFRSTYARGRVLSRRTGYRRDYGRNRYFAYDNVRGRPLFYRGPTDGRLRPMEKVVTVSIRGVHKAYPYRITQRARVINDEIGKEPIAVFHVAGAVSALDRKEIAESRNVGSTGVFRREIDGWALTFRYFNGRIYDEQTESVWNIAGKAVSGRLRGRELTPVAHGDFFSFAWFAFRPETQIYRPAGG